MQIRSTILVLILAIPMGMMAQTPADTGAATSPGRSLQIRMPISMRPAMKYPTCRDSLPIAGDTTGKGPVQPTLRQMATPPMPAPRKLRGKDVELRILVNVVGGIDSIVISDTSDAKYTRKWRESLLARQRYEPAVDGVCRRAAWASYNIHFH